MTPNVSNHTIFLHFALVFRIFVVGEHNHFKFSTHVDHSKSQSSKDKPSLKSAWLRHVTHFNFEAPYITQELAEPRVGMLMAVDICF